MKKQCITCTEFKEYSTDPELSEFNVEHVFPETIGGRYKVHNVCKVCNSIFGAKIDTPFVNGLWSVPERHKNDLTRGNRGIQNPFKGQIFYFDGKPHRIIFNEQGELDKELIPMMPEKDNRDPNKPITFEVDKKHEPLVREMIKKFFDRNGLSMEDYRGEVTENFIPAQEVNASMSNNIFLLIASKIAYEFTANQFPDYIKDLYAPEYRALLKSQIFTDTIRPFINPNLEIQQFMRAKFHEAIVVPNEKSHLALLTTIPNVGLVCLVKVFNRVTVMQMSESELYSRTVMVINNYESPKFEIVDLE